jgi:hypothetical protein
VHALDASDPVWRFLCISKQSWTSADATTCGVGWTLLSVPVPFRVFFEVLAAFLYRVFVWTPFPVCVRDTKVAARAVRLQLGFVKLWGLAYAGSAIALPLWKLNKVKQC